MSTLIQPRISWAAWLAGKALPLSICTLLAVAVGQSLWGEVAGPGRAGADVLTALGLLRRLLTLAFVILIAASYLTRAAAVAAARGFWERVFPVLVLLAGPTGVVLLNPREPTPSASLAILGLVLGLGGGCQSLWALSHLKRSFSIMIEARRLVTSGPYRYVRHPLYLGETLVLFGLCLMIGTGGAVLFAASISTLQLVRARLEEAKLARLFPEYGSYRNTTSFILPGLL
jgi:protein-S-isoprenylcysteine O-methyltransferase Ste14